PDTGCAGGACNPVAFGLPDAGSTPEPAQLPIPASIPHTPGSKVGLRASITSGPSGADGGSSSGTFECRVFDPPTPSTLQTSDATFALTIPVDSTRWISSGEVGLYAQRAVAQFDSIDILAGPTSATP